jgi:hypothetical protein
VDNRKVYDITDRSLKGNEIKKQAAAYDNCLCSGDDHGPSPVLITTYTCTHNLPVSFVSRISACLIFKHCADYMEYNLYMLFIRQNT